MQKWHGERASVAGAVETAGVAAEEDAGEADSAADAGAIASAVNAEAAVMAAHAEVVADVMGEMGRSHAAEVVADAEAASAVHNEQVAVAIEMMTEVGGVVPRAPHDLVARSVDATIGAMTDADITADLKMIGCGTIQTPIAQELEQMVG